MLSIDLNEIFDSIATENPWWDEGAIDERYNKLPRRDYFPPFLELVTQKEANRAVVLMGPRRVGKTVMLQHTVHALIESGIPARHILYVSIDTPTLTGQPLERLLKLFFEHHGLTRAQPAYILFDEIQYLKEWEKHLKSLVDRYPNTRFVASGSAAAALKLASHESGAGRFTDFLLPPLTFAEYLRFIGREEELTSAPFETIEELNKEFINYINFGGYPEAVMQPGVHKDASRYIKSDIIDKVLLRDLPSLYGISDIQELNRLFTYVAHRAGEVVSLDKLAQTSGVSKPTIKRYLEYLEAAFLIFRVRRVDERAAVFARDREFKVYLTNPSMRAALFKPVTEHSDIIGNLVENAIFSQWFHLNDFSNYYYARWKRRGRTGDGEDAYTEVDAVYIPPGDNKATIAVEIKWSDRFASGKEELTGLIEFSKKNQIKEIFATTKTFGGILHSGELKIYHSPSSFFCHTAAKALDGDTIRHFIPRGSADQQIPPIPN
jgi:predicted AAA+ superfamily ATPase